MSKCTVFVCPLRFICILISFSRYGAVTVKKDVTDINPGRYSLRISVAYSLNFKNGTRKLGSAYRYISFYVLGKSGDAN